jgi:glycosyltransferase involved in cell wall biosynthesis
MRAALPVSVCIPTRNEESTIATCLSAVRDAFDDIVVVDSESTDRTREIASQHAARVVPFHWNGRFPKKRNWALRNVDFANAWVLFLDADEIVTEAFVRELASTVPTTPHVGFWLTYTNQFMGQVVRHGDRLRKLALFRRDAGEYEAFPEEFWSTLDMEVHEHPVLAGSVGTIHEPIDHRDDRGLHRYIAKHNDYSTWEANRYRWFASAGADAWQALNSRQRFKYSHLAKWWLADLYFLTCLFAKGGVLDGAAGWRFAAMKRRYFQDVRLKILEHRRSGPVPPQGSCATLRAH